jgi:hypothetical protein
MKNLKKYIILYLDSFPSSSTPIASLETKCKPYADQTTKSKILDMSQDSHFETSPKHKTISPVASSGAAWDAYLSPSNLDFTFTANDNDIDD